MIAKPAPAGRVIIQDSKIEPTTRVLSAPIPRAKPTPNTAPTRVWVVEMGRPVAEAMTTVPPHQAPRRNRGWV